MNEPQETRKEKETRWATQRVTYTKELHDSQAAGRRRTLRKIIVAVIIIIIGVAITVVLR